MHPTTFEQQLIHFDRDCVTLAGIGMCFRMNCRPSYLAKALTHEGTEESLIEPTSLLLAVGLVASSPREIQHGLRQRLPGVRNQLLWAERANVRV